MARSRNPRKMIRYGIFSVFVVAIVAILAFDSNFKNFASIAYPPIPDEQYQYIDEAAAHCKIPKNRRGLIAALAWKESTFNEKAQSGAGAKGVTQVLSGTALGIANEYQIGGLDAQSIYTARIGYLVGACYLRDTLLAIGDGTDASWDNTTYVKGALIAYNAGPARGKSYIAGAYNGPSSSLGYADRILEAEQVYALDILHHDQQLQSQPVTASNTLGDIRQSVWKFLLGQTGQ